MCKQLYVSVVVVSVFMFAQTSYAQDNANAKRIYSSTIDSKSDLIRHCGEVYFPELEVRPIGDMPLNFIASFRSNSWSFDPAIGLDIGSLWWTPVRPKCILENDITAVAPWDGLSFHFILVPNIAFMTLDNSSGTGKDGGVMISGGAGVFFDYNFVGGGHSNKVSIGFMGRIGYFIDIQSNQNSAVLMIGPSLILGR